jgi:hypothetical protein
MAIRSRIVVLNRVAVTVAAQTDAHFGSVFMAKAGKLTGVNVMAVSVAGTAARTFQVYKAGSVAAAEASATTAMLATPAALADTPLPASGIVKADGSERFIAGETLYVKYTTGATTTSTDTTVTLNVDY